MTATPPEGAAKKTTLFDCLALFFLGLFTYVNVFPNQFIYDDEMDIQRNAFIRDFSHLGQIFTSCVGAGSQTPSNFYRPLQNILYAVVYKIWGLDVFGYHLLNVTLHLSNAVLIYILFRKFSKSRFVALGTALFFAVHPVETEAVTLMNGIADPLSVFFFLGALMFYQSEKTKAFTAAILFFILALLSKETAVVFSALFVLTDILQNKFTLSRWGRYATLAAVTGSYLAIRSTSLNFTNSFNLFSTSNVYTEHLSYRFYTFLAALMDYWHVLLWPDRLMYDRPMTVYTTPFIPKVAISFILLILILCVAVVSWRRNKILFCAVAWFFIPLIPVSGIIPINGFVMEHWLYLPSVGFFFIAATQIETIWKKFAPQKFSWQAAALVILALPLGVRTWARNQDYRGPLSFYPLILSYNPNIARIHNNLAMALDDAGQYKEAEDHYKAAMDLQKNLPQPHHNLGRLYLKEGKTNLAIEEFKEASDLDPNFPFSHAELIKIYRADGNETLARQEETALQAILSKNDK